MTAIKPFLNQLFEPLLILTSFPIPLFSPPRSSSSSNAFDEIEFPRRGFPLAITDWRDMLIYLYTSRVHNIEDECYASMRIAMRKHAEGLRVQEVRRYVRDGHQIVIAQVVEEEAGKKNWVVRSGVRLLRFERGAAVNDVAEADEKFAASMKQEPPVAGLQSLGHQQAPVVDQPSEPIGNGGNNLVDDDSSRPERQLQLINSSHASGSTKPAYETLESPPPPLSPAEELQSIKITVPSTPPPPRSPTSESIPQAVKPPHPSISIYSAYAQSHTRECSGDGEGSFVDTVVQSTVDRDLQGWTLLETIQPKALYLHHLALLLAEVHDYSVSADAKRSLSLPRGTVASASCSGFAEMVMAILKDEEGSVCEVVSPEQIAPATATEDLVEGIKEIRFDYLKVKKRVERKIYSSATQSKGDIIEHHEFAHPVN